MSQIKQYGARGPLSDPPILGEYIMVTYADHLAALRACEQRIKTHEGCADSERIEGYVDGYADALDAAREAVASISGQGVFVPRIYKHVALTAIDALKEKQ